MSGVYGQQNPTTTANEYNTLEFVIKQLLGKVQTISLVRVEACSNSGGLSPVGTVDMTVLANLMTGNRQPIPHEVLTGRPYLRIQGGSNAFIIDPEPDDLGIAVFCSRDSSAVIATRGQANPGSFRQFDWADGLYLGGFLNGTPSQYVQFSSLGISIVSPTKISLSAPTIELQATGSIVVNSPSNSIEGGGTSIDGKPFLPHDHTLVQPGSGNSGPVG